MPNRTFFDHLADILKAAIAVAVMAAFQAFLEYLGAHLPTAAELASLWASGFAAIKIRLCHFV